MEKPFPDWFIMNYKSIKTTTEINLSLGQVLFQTDTKMEKNNKWKLYNKHKQNKNKR